MYQFTWLQPGTKGNILQLGLGTREGWVQVPSDWALCGPSTAHTRRSRHRRGYHNRCIPGTHGSTTCEVCGLVICLIRVGDGGFVESWCS